MPSLRAGENMEVISLEEDEVVAAARSIFADDMKPYGRLLLKRLRERAAERVAKAKGLHVSEVLPESMPRIDPKRLRAVCEACRKLHVNSEDGREFSVYIEGERAVFLDVCSSEDTYSAHIWEGFAAYLAALDEHTLLPGGRYACARELMQLELSFLEGLTLAQVCHLVQLATSTRKLLGYKGKSLVPYAYSSDYLKAECALKGSPMSTDTLPAATWEQAIECLRMLANTRLANEPGGLTISNVKRLVRSTFSLELSETALGHLRLVDLLHDVRFRGVYRIVEPKSGQLAMRPVEIEQRAHGMQAPPGVWNSNASCSGSAVTVVGVLSHVPGLQLPAFSGLAQSACSSAVGPLNFLLAHEAPCGVPSDCDSEGLLSPGASPRGASPMVSSAHSLSSWSSLWSSSSLSTASVSDEEPEEPSTKEGEEKELAADPIMDWHVHVRGTFINISACDRGARQRSRSVPVGGERF